MQNKEAVAGDYSSVIPHSTFRTPHSEPLLRKEAGAILILLLLTGMIHAWLIKHTELPARDGVGFIHYAWRLQHEPWGEVLRTSLQHPGYPLIIGTTSSIIPIEKGSLCDRMILSAQLVNLAAGCLLAIAMFYLGKELFNRRVGFWTAALFQCLPVVARVTADVLSEATFLLTATVTLLLAVRSLRDYSIWRLGLCGACGGCCFLIRPEGGLTVLAVAAALFGLQTMVRWRQPWRRVLPAAASLTLAALLVAGPYVLVLGHLTNKPTSLKVMQVRNAERRTPTDRHGDKETRRQGQIRPKDGTRDLSVSLSPCPRVSLSPCLSVSASLFRTPHSAFRIPWAVWWHADREGGWLEGLAWAVWALTQAVVRCFGYIAWLPAVLGLYWCRGQWRNRPERLILGLLCLFQALVLCRVGLVVGYVSERHVLIIVLCGLYWAVWAILTSPQQLASLAQHRRSRMEDRGSKNEERGSRIEDRELEMDQERSFRSSILDPRSSSLDPQSSILPVGILLAFMLACLPVSLQPLHANQVGHREAGLWLAEHAQPGDIIVDPFDWAYFYAGRVFQNRTASLILPDQPPKRYVVLEMSRKPHPELIMLAEATQLAADGHVVYDWQPNGRQLKHRAQEVQIFAVPIPTNQ